MLPELGNVRIGVSFLLGKDGLPALEREPQLDWGLAGLPPAWDKGLCLLQFDLVVENF